MQVGICYSLCRSKSSTELKLSVSKSDVKQSFSIFIFIFIFIFYLQITRTSIISQMSSNFSQILPRTAELAALERLKNPIDL